MKRKMLLRNRVTSSIFSIDCQWIDKLREMENILWQQNDEEANERKAHKLFFLLSSRLSLCSIIMLHTQFFLTLVYIYYLRSPWSWFFALIYCIPADPPKRVVRQGWWTERNQVRPPTCITWDTCYRLACTQNFSMIFQAFHSNNFAVGVRVVKKNKYMSHLKSFFTAFSSAIEEKKLKKLKNEH